ncbi:MAG TPA: hypothetical protein VFX33_13100 [Actinomycetales bacterium]|nr:hypothetical protein [Actinomycetales bacterium]
MTARLDIPAERSPLPPRQAFRAVGQCVVRTVGLLAQRRIHQPRSMLGARLCFSDGTCGTVYRETVSDFVPAEPCILVVSFRLKLIRGRGHSVFRFESELNTPLFVGFRGFVSKLWLTHDEVGRYRGFYEWDGAASADDYARALWQVLALVSDRASIHYQVLPTLRRDEVLDDPTLLGRIPGTGEWWRLVRTTRSDD